VKVTNETQKTNQRMGTICLMIGMFLNPFGYDILTKMVMDITGSYWTTMHIFYLLAGLFFGLSFYFYRTNPIKAIANWINDIKTKITGLITK
jgi:hypothetical protein